MKKIAGLNCIHKENNSKNLVIMLHGYGADCNDLAPLGDVLDPNGEFDWVFPNGFIEVPIGLMMSGRAWFPIRMMDFQNAVSSGEFPEYFASQNPDGLDIASEKIKALIAELSKSYENIILGGFSQGAMLTTDVFLTSEHNLEKIILMSGAFTKRQIWENHKERLLKKEIFQSHGQQDPVLPFATSQLLRNFLIDGKAQLDYHEFLGGHEIPPPVLRGLATFLGTLK